MMNSCESGSPTLNPLAPGNDRRTEIQHGVIPENAKYPNNKRKDYKTFKSQEHTEKEATDQITLLVYRF
jgi:hypothetical protein